MKNLFLIICLFICTYSFAQCPPEGTAKNEKEKHLNILKNGSASIPDKKPKVKRLSTFINKGAKNDSVRFKEGMYVSVTGYIVSLQEEGAESCNCNMADEKKKNGDVHIYFGLIADAPKKNCMVVEITPAYKILHPDYASSLEKGNKVKFTGYLLYDYLHESAAINTCTKCDNAWRKTCWEIHPVVKIESVE